MFHYSLGVQAQTKEAALRDLDVHVMSLAENHPETAKRYDAHLSAVLESAETLTKLLPDDVDGTDVAISVAGHLTVTKGAADVDEVQTAEFTVHVGRVSADSTKHAKVVKPPRKKSEAVVSKEAPPKVD